EAAERSLHEAGSRWLRLRARRRSAPGAGPAGRRRRRPRRKSTTRPDGAWRASACPPGHPCHGADPDGLIAATSSSVATVGRSQPAWLVASLLLSSQRSSSAGGTPCPLTWASRASSSGRNPGVLGVGLDARGALDGLSAARSSRRPASEGTYV